MWIHTCSTCMIHPCRAMFGETEETHQHLPRWDTGRRVFPQQSLSLQEKPWLPFLEKTYGITDGHNYISWWQPSGFEFFSRFLHTCWVAELHANSGCPLNPLRLGPKVRVVSSMPTFAFWSTTHLGIEILEQKLKSSLNTLKDYFYIWRKGWVEFDFTDGWLRLISIFHV